MKYFDVAISLPLAGKIPNWKACWTDAARGDRVFDFKRLGDAQYTVGVRRELTLAEQKGLLRLL